MRPSRVAKLAQHFIKHLGEIFDQFDRGFTSKNSCIDIGCQLNPHQCLFNCCHNSTAFNVVNSGKIPENLYKFLGLNPQSGHKVITIPY